MGLDIPDLLDIYRLLGLDSRKCAWNVGHSEIRNRSSNTMRVLAASWPHPHTSAAHTYRDTLHTETASGKARQIEQRIWRWEDAGMEQIIITTMVIVIIMIMTGMIWMYVCSTGYASFNNNYPSPNYQNTREILWRSRLYELFYENFKRINAPKI